MTLTDGPWIASAPHPHTRAITIVNPHGRVIAAVVPSADDAAFICEARAAVQQAVAERERLATENQAMRITLDLTRQHIDAEIMRLMRVERDLRAQLDQAHQHVVALAGAIDEAHQTLWHYDLARRPCGVDWEPIEELRAKMITQLSNAYEPARAWLRRA